VCLLSEDFAKKTLGCRAFERLVTTFYQTALLAINDPFFDLNILPQLSHNEPSLPNDVRILLSTVHHQESVVLLSLRQKALETGLPIIQVSNAILDSSGSGELINQIERFVKEDKKEEVDMKPTFTHSAVGGTFDHLHYGHKIMLTVAAYLTEISLLVGITGEVLLQKKAFKEEIQSYEERYRNVNTFLGSLQKEGIVYNLVEINDIYGPTATQKELDILVLSKETLPSAELINKKRQESGLSTIQFFAIELLSSPPSLPRSPSCHQIVLF